MNIDKQTLRHARQWAEHIAEDDDLLPQESIDAAVEVIQALPDEILDAAKVRELAENYQIIVEEALKSYGQGIHHGRPLAQHIADALRRDLAPVDLKPRPVGGAA